jgi:hypothetical protein
MLNTCPQCGLYRDDKVVDVQGQFVTCPECGHNHPFNILPLFIVSGPSGAGKSAVLLELLSRQLPVIALEGDQLWGLLINSGKAGYPDFNDIWLRLAKNMNQSGMPCALFSAGAVIPHDKAHFLDAQSAANLGFRIGTQGDLLQFLADEFSQP